MAGKTALPRSEQRVRESVRVSSTMTKLSPFSSQPGSMPHHRLASIQIEKMFFFEKRLVKHKLP